MEKIVAGILGSAGRESVLYDVLKRSEIVSRVRCFPGNGGIPRADRRNIKVDDFPALLEAAKQENITLLVVGPEQPLVDGIVDYFKRQAPGIVVFGPSKLAARLEGSKIFMKTRCQRWGIRTADFDFTGDYKIAEQIIKRTGFRVIKAEGLAAGKGVAVTESEEEALRAAHQMLVEKVHGSAGSRIVIEKRLEGVECSAMALCDGEWAVQLWPASDYKRAFENNDGPNPNTGGMGAYSWPVGFDKVLFGRIQKEILDKLVAGMKAEGAPYHGVLYAGVMVTPEGDPYLLEVNCRFGDPEIAVIIPALETDLARLMLDCMKQGGLAEDDADLIYDLYTRVCVVGTTKEYPEPSTAKGEKILGIEEARRLGVEVFHAGTEELSDGSIVVNGGRLFHVVGKGMTIAEARAHAYRGMEKIKFPGRYRSDIAKGL